MVLETLAESLRAAYGEAISVEIPAGLLHLIIGKKGIWINAEGKLEGESFSGVRSDDVGVDPDCSVVASATTSLTSGI